MAAIRDPYTIANIDKVIAWAKAHPEEVRMGSSGTGTTSHLYMELVKRVAGIDITRSADDDAGLCAAVRKALLARGVGRGAVRPGVPVIDVPRADQAESDRIAK